MATRRCTPCGLSWPHKPRYAVCRQCGGRTDVIYNGTPMEQSEANHIEFEAYYKQREEANEKVLRELEAAAEAARAPQDPPPAVAGQPESD